jgi:hypothetical protein
MAANQEQPVTGVPEWCIGCSGGLTRSKHTPDQPPNSHKCASCYYNEVHTPTPLMELGELEALIEQAGDNASQDFFTSLVGRLVDWHGTPASICLINNAIRLEVDLTCRCGASGPTVYMGEGLHDGAWPYAYDQHNTYLMNARDQEYVCETCIPKHQAMLARIATMHDQK